MRFPTLNIVGCDNSGQIKSALANLEKYHWVIFISANAVNFALKANSGKIARTKSPDPLLHSGGFAAVGQSTATAMKMADLPVDLVPEQNCNSEALLEMPELQQVQGQNILIVRGEGGREQLATTLRDRGAEVNYLEVYKRTVPQINSSSIVNLLAQKKIDVITVTSA